MDASTSMAYSRLGQEAPRCSSSSPVVEEEDLFDEIFDWRLYCESTQELEPSHSPGHQKLQYLSKLKTQFSPTSLDLDGLAFNNLHSDFGRMRSRVRSDDDAATASDYSGHSPPDLIQGGGSTSPSDHSGSVFLDHSEERTFLANVTLQQVQAQVDEWTYSQTAVDPAKAAHTGHPAPILIQGEYADLQATQSAGTKRRRSINESDKRPRQLVDPMQTADVRKSGACVPCRVTKTRCHDSGVCPTCRKAFPNHSHLVCTRMTPAMAWPVMTGVPDFWSNFAAEEDYLCCGPRFFTGSPRDISILFSGDKYSPSLHATVQAYRSTNSQEETGSLRTAAFPREKVPSHSKLETWVEKQMERETGPEFSLLLQNFLRVYSKEGLKKLPKVCDVFPWTGLFAVVVLSSSLTVVFGESELEEELTRKLQQDLVRTVHKMNCFFRIWKMPSFMCIDPSKKLVPLPVSVQAQLRRIAREALYRLEHDVLKMLDDCLSQQGSPKAEERVAIWVSMWQLMLMYRQLLIAYKTHLGHMMQDPSSPDEFITSQTQQCRRLIENFYPLLAVFYHYQFRTKKSIELSFDWLENMSSSNVPPEDKSQIRHFGQQLLVSRRALYSYVGSSAEKEDVDKMLWTFVVEHELKKLNARKRNPKGSNSKPGPSRRVDEGFDDE
ncbi:hypothetical protein E4U41_004237 [Claviceps citrina]|nr:hypothetical protein E4U41_004237 [Claviceps citrina]